MERRKTRLEYLKFQRAEKLQNNAMQTIMDVVEAIKKYANSA